MLLLTSSNEPKLCSGAEFSNCNSTILSGVSALWPLFRYSATTILRCIKVHLQAASRTTLQIHSTATVAINLPNWPYFSSRKITSVSFYRCCFYRNPDVWTTMGLDIAHWSRLWFRSWGLLDPTDHTILLHCNFLTAFPRFLIFKTMDFAHKRFPPCVGHLQFACFLGAEASLLRDFIHSAIEADAGLASSTINS